MLVYSVYNIKFSSTNTRLMHSFQLLMNWMDKITKPVIEYVSTGNCGVIQGRDKKSSTKVIQFIEEPS